MVSLAKSGKKNALIVIHSLFFELLQVALGNRERLSRTPSAAEWAEIYAVSEQQAVTGILLYGIERLKNLNADLNLNQRFLLQWIGVGQMIEQRNHLLDERCKELLSNLTSAGLHPTILKGQGVAQYYPTALQRLRQPGDIDVCVSDGRIKAIAYAKSIGQKDINWDYKHLHLRVWDDTEVEMHYHVEVLLNLWKNKRLQKWFKENEVLLYFNNADLVTPTIEMNLFYILLHIYRHFFTEGVGLRQLIDYYFVLVTANGTLPKYVGGKSLENVLKSFGMWRFARGVMWIMQEIFALDRKYMYCEPLEKEGRFILDIVLDGGNFGHKNSFNVKGIGRVNTLVSVAKHNIQILKKYPLEALLSPLWYVWHKAWKLRTLLYD